MVNYELIKSIDVLYHSDSENLIESLTAYQKKDLIDSLVDPAFVINNANSMLKEKLEKFLDAETREYFYMIDRANKKITFTLEKLRKSLYSQSND